MQQVQVEHMDRHVHEKIEDHIIIFPQNVALLTQY